MKIKEIYEKETGFEAWSFDNKPSKQYTKWLENKLEAINYTRCCTEVCDCEVPNVDSKLICNKCDKDFR